MTPSRSLQNRPASLCLLAGTFLLAVPISRAQQDLPRTLTGTVTDRSKEPLKGAIVEVQNESTTSIVSYITDASGTFAFKRLSSNADYRVTVTYRGHHPKARELSHFDSNANPVFHFVIKLD